jgi:hypothetical protein
MTVQPRILLATPGGSAIQSAESHIICGDATSLVRAAHSRFAELDYWATAFISSRFKSDILLDAVRNADGKSILLLPLRGYEWISEMRDVPAHILALLPGIGVGVLMVVPAAYLPELKHAHDAMARDEIAQFSRRGLGVEIVAGVSHFACPLYSFDLPLLAPGVAGAPEWNQPYFDEAWLNEVEDGSPRGVAVKAGILQMNGRLDASHHLAQSIEGHPDGDYWHAIMHRREPDYGNSKYWFRRIGRHPVFAQLAPRAAEIMNDAPGDVRSRWTARLKLDAGWDPFAFVDLCEAAAGDEENALGVTARRIQWSEMLLLLKHTASKQP